MIAHPLFSFPVICPLSQAVFSCTTQMWFLYWINYLFIFILFIFRNKQALKIFKTMNELFLQICIFSSTTQMLILYWMNYLFAHILFYFRDVRVQILILFQTFFASSQNPIFRLLMLWKTHLLIWGAVMAERLEPWTSIPEVPGSSPGPAVAPLGKALYPHCLVFRRRL